MKFFAFGGLGVLTTISVIVFLMLGFGNGFGNTSGVFLQSTHTQTATIIPTATPTPSPTATPTPTTTPTQVYFTERALLYMPNLSDIPSYYRLEDDRMVTVIKDELGLPQKNEAIEHFVSHSQGSIYGPQDGHPMEFNYWIKVLLNSNEAQAYYKKINEHDFMKLPFSLVDFNVVTKGLGPVLTIETSSSKCDEQKIYKTTGELLLPLVQIYSPCRVGNLVIIYTSFAINNYDGNGLPLPDDVLIQQTDFFISLITKKLND